MPLSKTQARVSSAGLGMILGTLVAARIAVKSMGYGLASITFVLLAVAFLGALATRLVIALVRGESLAVVGIDEQKRTSPVTLAAATLLALPAATAASYQLAVALLRATSVEAVVVWAVVDSFFVAMLLMIVREFRKPAPKAAA